MKTTPYLEKVHTWVADKVKELPAPAAGAVVALVQVLEQEPGVVLVPGNQSEMSIVINQSQLTCPPARCRC